MREEREGSLREVRTEANRTQSLIAAAQAKIESMLSQFEGNRERARQLAEEDEKLRIEHEQAVIEKQKQVEELESRTTKIASLVEDLESCERKFQHTRGDLDASRDAAGEAHKQLAKVSSRLEVLKQLVDSGEGFQKGTQSVLSGLDDKELYEGGVRGVLANFIQVENSFAPAVEAALGSHLQTVLVRDNMLAESIIDTLTEKKMGEAAILPEDFIPVQSEAQLMHVPDGAEAWALDKVEADKIVAPVITRLLENVLVVKDLKLAAKLRKDLPDVTFVTLAGEVMSPEGIIRGGVGGDASSSVLERQNEIRELEESNARLVEEEQVAKQKVETLESLMAEQREAVEQARERLQKARVDESTLQGQVSLATREVESLESKISNNEWERNELKERENSALGNRETQEADLATARQRLEELETSQLMLNRELEDSMNREQEAATVLNELRTNLAVERRALQSAEEQQQPMAARLEELRHLTSRRESEIISFRERIESATGENAQLLEEIETATAAANFLEERLEEAASGRNAILESISVAEKELGEVRRQVSKISDQKGKEEVSATKVELRLESLQENMMERHQIDLEVFRPDSHALLLCIADQEESLCPQCPPQVQPQ